VRRILLVSAVTAMTLTAVAVLALAQNPPVSTAQPGGNGHRGTIIASGISPRALAVDPRSNIYLTNATSPNRIFTLTGLAGLGTHNPAGADLTARLALVAGDGVAGSLGDGGNGLAAQFNLHLDSLAARSGIAVGNDGTIFVADTLNATVRRIAGSDSSETGTVRSIAGRWASGQSVQIVEPLGLALDRNGNLYVADRAAGAIDMLPNAIGSDPGGQQVQVLAHIASPASIALTVDGRKAFVTSLDTGAILEVNTQTRAIRAVPGFAAQKNAQDGSKSPCGAGPRQANSAKPVCPSGLAVDGAGNLFVADMNSEDILRFDAKTSALATAATGLSAPGDMSFDRDGNLYVAEQGANRIVKFASMGAAASTLTITPPAALAPPPAPRVCPPTAPFDFCDQPVGGSTSAQSFTLTNNAAAAVTGIAISFTGADPGDFQASSNTCGTSLGAGASCTINVDFAPTASGSRSATLSVTDSAADSASSVVTGTGDDYQLILNGSPQQQSVIQGGTITYNFNIVPDPVFGGDVSIVCPAKLPPLTTCTPDQGTVTVTPGTQASFSITFQTTYNGVTGGFPTNGFLPGALIDRDHRGHVALSSWLGCVGIVFFCLGLLALARWRSKRPLFNRHLPANVLSFTSLLLVACAFVFLAGCKHHSVPSNLNTPAGVTSLTIQGTAQNAGRGVTIALDVVGRG
jgi:sugar lactone lactonase YvrE